MATSVTLKPNAIDISGSTSGTTTLQASAVAGTTTLTLPAATDTLVGKATTDTLTNKTLTGAAMNGTLGATTPSTASVTTLTTSSTVTHSGGTANGVAYLDGSKALTTGSALVFDGTNLRVGTTSSLSVADKLTVVGGNFAVQRTSGITTFMGDNTADGYAGTATNHAFALLTNSTERCRITSGGDLLVGTTSNPNSAKIAIGPTASNGISIESNSTSVVMSQLLFRNPNGIVGSVQTSGSTTTYATSSDYRLKNSIAPMTSALARVAALKPCTYKWNADGSDGEGFIAHELAEVCPHAVVGEKDAVNEDGSIKPQGIDTSFLVATLTAAIQELSAQVTQLQADVASLKGA